MIKLLRAFIGVAIGGMLLWLALRDQSAEDVLAVWAGSDGSWLLLGAAIYGTSLIVRVARWSCLLAVVVPARALAVGEVLLVGNAINNVLPARLGELFRADYGKRRLGSTRSALLATIVVEALGRFGRDRSGAVVRHDRSRTDGPPCWKAVANHQPRGHNRRLSAGGCAHRCGRLAAHGVAASVAAWVCARQSRGPGEKLAGLGRCTQEPLRHPDARRLEPGGGRAGL